MKSSNYIHPKSEIIGSVEIGAFSSVWPGAVIRGDLTDIRIGSYTSIQDNCVVHGDFGYPVEIGNFVTTGHGAVIHGSCIEDCSVIGMNSVIQNNCSIGKGSIVAAGSLMKSGTKVPPFSLVVGNPCVIKENYYSDYTSNLKSALIYYYISQLNIKYGYIDKKRIAEIYSTSEKESLRINDIYLQNKNFDIEEIRISFNEIF